MKQQLFQIALVVDDYDRAIDFYTKILGFELRENTTISETKRWVIVSPKGSECSVLLARAVGDEQERCIGNQTGGRVFLFLRTDDFWKDYNSMKDKGVVFHGAPRVEKYGTVIVFQDLYGNRWDLIG